MEKNDALSSIYTYDADGRRVRSWFNVSDVTDYVYSGLNVIDEVSGGVHEKHVYSGGMHIASNSNGTVEYYHQDHLGSTRLKTNSTGGVVYMSNYEPYGPGYGEQGSEEYRYTGKQEDPTGLYYYGARYYDPVTGRFTTRDTVFGDLTDPQSLNRYSYCRNNPHKYTDPDGRIPLWAVGAIVGGGMNFGYYWWTHRDGTFNRNEAIATTVAGAVSGAITGATLGLFNPGGVMAGATMVEKIIVKGTVDVLANTAETTTELVVNNMLEKKDRQNNVVIIGEGIGDTSIGLTQTGAEYLSKIDKLDVIKPETFTPRKVAGGIVRSKIITWAIRDRWWEHFSLPERTPSTGGSTYYIEQNLE